jgi:hypothetical protein
MAFFTARWGPTPNALAGVASLAGDLEVVT